MDESERETGFKVSDRRRFTPDGEVKEETETSQEEPRRQEPAQEETQEGKQEAGETPAGEKEPPQQVDFTGLVIGLGNSALLQMGFAQGPEGQKMKDLGAARQTIDIIAMLEEKTKGNLSEQESKIIKETLFQLRMAFVEASK